MISELSNPYTVGIILIIFVGVWTAIGMSKTNRAFSHIVRIARTGSQLLDGQPLEYWLQELNRDPNVTLTVNRYYILSWQGHDYWLIDGTARYLTLGRFGPLSAQSYIKCLVTADGQARMALESRTKMFKLLISRDEVAAFTVRRLTDFAKECVRPPHVL